MNRFRLNKINDGIQMVVSLDCFDISVVSHKYSYGGDEGLYELGVFWVDEPVYYNDTNFDRKEFVNEVVGWLNEEAVTDKVNKLMSLDQSSNSLVSDMLDVLRV